MTVNIYFHSSSFNVSVEAETAETAKAEFENLRGLIDEFGGEDDSDDSGSAPKKTTRKRRTKAEIAADKAAAEAKESGSDAEKTSGQAQDPAAETAKEPEVSEAEMRKSCEALIALGAEGARASVSVIEALKAFDENGNPKLKALKPEQYAEAKRMLDEKVTELSAKPAAGVL